MNKQAPIGVMDSGVGGLTTLKELVKLLPGENIVYCGDNANAPYGNRSEDEIVGLTQRMLTFMQTHGVKVVAVACNTISSTFESPKHGGYERAYGFPVRSIIRCAAEDVVRQGYKEVGVIATAFTIQSQCYNRLIQAIDPSIHVHGEPSRDLAMLIERGDLKSPEILAEVKKHVTNLLAQASVKEIVLGCTHYPIVQSIFEAQAPGVSFINPARDQALSIKTYLQSQNLLNDQRSGTLNINTSGSAQIFDTILEELGIPGHPQVNITQF